MFLPEVPLFVTTAALTRRLDSNQKYLWFPLRFPAALRASYLRHGLKWQERIDQPIDPARLPLTTSATPGQNNKMWGWRSAPCALSGRNVCAPIWIQKHIIFFFHPYHAMEVKLWGQALFREEMKRKGLCEATSSGDSCSLEWTHPPKTKDIWHIYIPNLSKPGGIGSINWPCVAFGVPYRHRCAVQCSIMSDAWLFSFLFKEHRRKVTAALFFFSTGLCWGIQPHPSALCPTSIVSLRP